MFPLDVEFDQGAVAAVIDITTSQAQCVNLVTPKRDAFHEAVSDTIPTMLTQVTSGNHVLHADSSGGQPPAIWRTDDFDVNVMADKSAFAEQIHKSAETAGADLIRVEIPGAHSAPFANSVWQTEWIGHSIEQIAGMLLGALIVNLEDAQVVGAD